MITSRTPRERFPRGCRENTALAITRALTLMDPSHPAVPALLLALVELGVPAPIIAERMARIQPAVAVACGDGGLQ